MKRNHLSWLFLLQIVFVFMSCQKKGIENNQNVNNGNELNAPVSPLSIDVLKYYYKGSTNNNIYSGNSADGFNWNSTQVNNGASTNSGPAAAFLNGNIYMIHKGRTNNNLYFSTSGNNGNNWSSDVAFNNGAGTVRTPSACAFNGKLYVAYVSTKFDDKDTEPYYHSHSKIYYSYSSDGGATWTESIIDYETFDEPWIFTDGTQIYIAFANVKELNSFALVSSTDGITWFNTSVAPYPAIHQSVAVNSNGRACMVRCDGNQQISVQYSDDKINWSAPSYLLNSSNGIAASSQRPTITFDRTNNRFVVVYKGLTNNNIYYADDRDGVLRERGTANGSTTESPYALFVN
ncbi:MULTISPECIES: sialidase family protein [Niastella]|uniref:Exo-alpha-sialidase n=1 Tax=Niastella soli TaxID=2821487 RepID=A0ABS3YPX6_9BACT|nr:sialidase family protein [Niastella soli]MBO9199943.1 exo-alpha-sialidase [Niastella soli]